MDEGSSGAFVIVFYRGGICPAVASYRLMRIEPNTLDIHSKLYFSRIERDSSIEFHYVITRSDYQFLTFP